MNRLKCHLQGARKTRSDRVRFSRSPKRAWRRLLEASELSHENAEIDNEFLARCFVEMNAT